MQEKRDRREEFKEGTEERCQMIERRERKRDERGVGKKDQKRDKKGILKE